MAWFWTDDLARALVATGEVERSMVTSWVERPVAVSAPADADPLEVGRSVLGLPDAIEAGAA